MTTQPSHTTFAHRPFRLLKIAPVWLVCALLSLAALTSVSPATEFITSGPLTLSAPGSSSTSPAIVSSKWGDLYAVWESTQGGVTRIMFASGTLRGWSSPVAISRPGAPSSLHPVLAIDSTGALHTAWCEDNSTTSGILMRTLTSGAWGAPQLIRERRLFHCEYPSIALGVDNGDGLAIVWQERYGSLSGVMGAALLPGMTEFRISPLPAGAESGDFQIYPILLPTPREATTYWYSIEENQMRLHAAELDLTRGEWYDVDATLAPCAPLERLPLLFPPPTMALGALWVEESSPAQSSQIRLEVRDTCEGIAIAASSGELMQDVFPAIANIAPNDVMLAWRVMTPSGPAIKIATLDTDTLAVDASTFPPSAPDLSTGSSQPAIAVDGFGIMHLLWISDPSAGGDGGLRYSYGFAANTIFNF